MYVDPPAPKAFNPYDPKDRPPSATAGALDDTTATWRFNPDYDRLVEAWNTVMPQLEQLRTALDKAYNRARSPQTWDAPVGERYVQEIREWRTKLAVYRHAVLTAISDRAADTPRWLPTTASIPRAN
ncbi:hypothetical protein ETD86_14070 [Nonomuraea turkmeniaca]|uniref:Uncharacterized protein n=1 Tax=Nonomuraea turkmeniaca TaxID=103838 RepID=A0A5S4FM29_9ACTN|nr:hypothetical protein [Nonomuraea turkmeniaca]TMR21786.1 hypothetical protein ETD86_14070 [Nonomuraea turkmeniaca]